jgi:guanylate kinase
MTARAEAKPVFPVILSSPSGVGKTTIARKVLEHRADVGYSVSCTTRAPRAGEVHGRDYFFWTADQFAEGRDRGDFAEFAEVHGRMYGTLRSEVDRVLQGGRHVLMDIDVQGAERFARAYPQAVLVFLLPPSAEVLVGRLQQRRSESPEALTLRLRNAIEELRAAERYTYLVENADLEVAIRYVSSVIDAESVRRDRDPGARRRIESLIDDLSAHRF